MKLTDREKIILTLLPLALILGGYAWWFNMFERHKLAKVQGEYDQAAKAAVRPIDVMNRKADVLGLEGEIEILTSENRELEQRVEQVCGTLTGAQRRMRAIDELTVLFDRHRLAIVEECPADQGKHKELPTSMAEATSRLMGSAKGRAGRVRCVHFAGRYADVLAALEEIAADETPAAIPVGLTMSEGDVAAELRKWTLLVWM